MVKRGSRVFFAESDAPGRERLRQELNAGATNVRMQRLADQLTTDVSLAERVAALGFEGEAAHYKALQEDQD